MVTFSTLFKHFQILWLMPVFAALVALGAAGQVSTWIVGPVKGLLATAKRGDLPPLFREVNDKGIPRNLLIFQASIITLVGGVILLIPSINLSFLMLTNLAVLLYAIAYTLMFAAAIRLRYTKPHIERPYCIPGGLIGIWLISGLGVLTAAACFFIGFIPPAGISKKEIIIVELFMLTGMVMMTLIPFLLIRYAPASWHKGIINEDGSVTRPGKTTE